MGYGDDLMGIGLVRLLAKEYPLAKFVFGDPDNYYDSENNRLRVNWSELFENHPLIVQPEEPVTEIVCVPDYPGARTYVDYENSTVEDGQIVKFKWKGDFVAPRGEIFFTKNEKSEAGEISMRLPYPFFIIEPNVASKPWFNHKSWPFDRWQEVVNALPDVCFAQFEGERYLKGVFQLDAPSFRQASAILSCSGGFVGTDGGLHHAAAALDVPAVVLWGHFSSPEVFGYNDQINIRHEDGVGCGSTWVECRECNESMLKITADEIVEAIKELLENGSDKIRRKSPDRPIFRMVGSAPEGEEE